MSEITIAIPTFRRPKGLARLLASLAELETGADVRVIVGENDTENRQGFAVCEEFRCKGYRWPLECIVVEERGISQNRNTLVACALADPAMKFLLMIDDDERVQPHWLDRMLRAQSGFGADAVEGHVTPVFGNGDAQRYYEGIASHRGASGPVEMLESSANILVTRDALARLVPPHFDNRFALTGGEDKDFFLRLKAAGARFAWSAEAVIYTDVPSTRAGLRWSLARAYRVGNSDMRIYLKHRTGLPGIAKELAKIAGALLLSPLAAFILMASPNRRMAALRKFVRAAGKASALFGTQYREYSVIHGE